MEIIHYIRFNADHAEHFFKRVQQLNIPFKLSPTPHGKFGIILFEIRESDSQWPEIKNLLKENQSFDYIATDFTTDEILKADWCRLFPEYEWGYPQPQRNKQWKELTYNNYCPKCGAGFTQKAPFCINKEPSIGKKHFFGIMTAYTLFCKKEILKDLENNCFQGVEYLDPLIKPNHYPSNEVTQMIFSHITNGGLCEKNKTGFSNCKFCGIEKYAHHRRGMMEYQKNKLIEGVDFQQTSEWFGSGSFIGFREIFVSKRVVKLITEMNWRGIKFLPIHLI